MLFRSGPSAEIFPFACIGHAPQDLKFAGEPSELVIGARCRIRENVTMNPGTKGGGMLTKVLAAKRAARLAKVRKSKGPAATIKTSGTSVTVRAPRLP